MKEKITKLIDVKSIVTLLLTILFFILACMQVIGSEQVVTIYTIIIGFYFGTQSNKKEVKADATDSKENYISEQNAETK